MKSKLTLIEVMIVAALISMVIFVPISFSIKLQAYNECREKHGITWCIIAVAK